MLYVCRLVYADVFYAYAGSLPKLLPAAGRLPERGFTRKIEAECVRIRGLLLEKVEAFMPHGSPWENSMREPEGKSMRSTSDACYAYVVRMLTYADVC
jgi:hypothetical protein